MNLTTERLSIRYIEPDDWKNLMEIWKDFRQSEFSQYDVPHTLDEGEIRGKAKRWAALSPKGEHLFFAVCRQEQMIGYVDFHRNPNGYECGYCFHSAFHGKGYAGESLQALFQWLSRDGDVCFTAGTALKNLPSVKLLSSLGFRKVGEEKVSFYKDEKGREIFFDGGIFTLDSRSIREGAASGE